MRWAVPVIHPAATFRTPTQLGPLMAHIEGFIRRGAFGFTPLPKLLEDPPLKALQKLERIARKRGLPLSIDVEASPPKNGRKEWALLPMYARLRTVGIGIDYPHKDKDGKQWDGLGLSWFFPLDKRVWRYILKLFADPSLEKVCMNGFSYDVPMLERHGVKFGGTIHDIRDMRRAMVSTSRTSLAFQASIEKQCAPWKAEASEDDDDEKGYIDPSRIKRHKVLRYNAEDTVRAAQVRQAQVNYLLRQDGGERTRIERLYKHGVRLAKVGAEMAIKGFPINEDKRQELSRNLTAMARTRAKEVARLVAPHAKVKILAPGENGAKYKDHFRISANGGVNDNDLAALLFRECRKKGISSFDLDVPLSEKCWTNSGKPSVNRDALLFLFAQDNTPEEVKQICFAVWKADSPLKARSTYIESDKVLARIGPDGRLHASINTCAAETGRWTCSDPNLFNLSEEVEEDSGDLRGDLPNIRAMYEAPPGWVIVHRDFSGVELEVMYDRTADELLRKLLLSGDVHTQRVREWFNKPAPMEVPKGLRRQAKTVGFSSQYGGGLETVFMKVLAKDPNAKWEDVQVLWHLFRTNHVGIVNGWQRAMHLAETLGYNETYILKRRRHYPPDTPIKITECLNYEVQGTAADIANSTMVGIEEHHYAKSLHGMLKRYFPDAWLAMHTYDSFDVICKKKDGPAVNRMMEECMNGPWDAGRGLRIFPSDGSIARSWGNV